MANQYQLCGGFETTEYNLTECALRWIISDANLILAAASHSSHLQATRLPETWASKRPIIAARNTVRRRLNSQSISYEDHD
jgi:hypothetical protein